MSLVTGCRLRLPKEIQPRLLELLITDRPGIEVAARWPALESFRLGLWKGTDLQFLNGALNLKRLRVEGRRHAGALDGLEGCQSLEEILTVNYAVSDTRSLHGLNLLKDVRMMAARPGGPHGIIDISDFSRSRLAKLWLANAENIQHLAILAELPHLREVRLIECRLTQADQRIMETLPSRVKVEMVNSQIVD